MLKNLSKLDKLPVYLRKPVFEKLFNIAEYSNLTKEEKMNYDSSLKYKWDNQNVMEYAIQQAVEQTRVEKDKEKEEAVEKAVVQKGIEKDREKEEVVQHTAKKLKELGISITAISLATGLSAATIEKL